MKEKIMKGIGLLKNMVKKSRLTPILLIFLTVSAMNLAATVRNINRIGVKWDFLTIFLNKLIPFIISPFINHSQILYEIKRLR